MNTIKVIDALINAAQSENRKSKLKTLTQRYRIGINEESKVWYIWGCFAVGNAIPYHPIDKASFHFMKRFFLKTYNLQYAFNGTVLDY